eukprot:scaffold248711_cov41-Prasinocladus_malaysianus.AAC.1
MSEGPAQCRKNCPGLNSTLCPSVYARSSPWCRLSGSQDIEGWPSAACHWRQSIRPCGRPSRTASGADGNGTGPTCRAAPRPRSDGLQKHWYVMSEPTR